MVNHARALKHVLCIGVALAACGTAKAQTTLFYSGNFDGGGHYNEEANGAGPDAQTFDTFTVHDPQGWTVSSVFSNDLQQYVTGDVTTEADWSIRTGMGPGDAGTVIYSGTDAAATQVATGGYGGKEYTISVDLSGLGIYLAPGTYWLDVTPVGGTSQWYNSTTQGAGGIDATSGFVGLYNSAGYNYSALGANFSLGVNGSVTPEGNSLAMFALGGLPLAIGFGRRLRRKGV